MIQMPVNLRGPALDLRDGLGDRAGDQPLCSKELRRHLREPARSNRSHARTRTPARGQARTHVRYCNRNRRAGSRRCAAVEPFLPGQIGWREQPRRSTGFVALSAPVFRRPWGASRWAVRQRKPPGRTGLRLNRPVGTGRRFCALWGRRARRSAPPLARDAACPCRRSRGHGERIERNRPACALRAGGRHGGQM